MPTTTKTTRQKAMTTARDLYMMLVEDVPENDTVKLLALAREQLRIVFAARGLLVDTITEEDVHGLVAAATKTKWCPRRVVTMETSTYWGTRKGEVFTGRRVYWWNGEHWLTATNAERSVDLPLTFFHFDDGVPA